MTVSLTPRTVAPEEKLKFTVRNSVPPCCSSPRPPDGKKVSKLVADHVPWKVGPPCSSGAQTISKLPDAWAVFAPVSKFPNPVRVIASPWSLSAMTALSESCRLKAHCAAAGAPGKKECSATSNLTLPPEPPGGTIYGSPATMGPETPSAIRTIWPGPLGLARGSLDWKSIVSMPRSFWSGTQPMKVLECQVALITGPLGWSKALNKVYVPLAEATPVAGSNVPPPVSRMDSYFGLFLLRAMGAFTILNVQASACAATTWPITIAPSNIPSGLVARQWPMPFVAPLFSSR